MLTAARQTRDPRQLKARSPQGMGGQIRRLITRKDRLTVQQAEEVRQAVLALPGIPQEAKSPLLTAIDQQAAAQNGWTFVMLSPAENRAVVRWLRQHSARPMVAAELWATLFERIDRTGRILATREELAAEVGVSAREISRLMGELVELGAVTKDFEKALGVRGRGIIRYRMNERIATRRTGQDRDKAQAEAPLLRVVE